MVRLDESLGYIINYMGTFLFCWAYLFICIQCIGVLRYLRFFIHEVGSLDCLYQEMLLAVVCPYGYPEYDNAT